MKIIVVTGAGGFLGKFVAEFFAEKEVKVFAVLKADSPKKIKQKFMIPIYCNMEEYEKLPILINKKVDVFFHFAWAGTSGEGRGKYSQQLDNIQYTCKAVEAAAKLNCKKFIYAGSIMEYEIMQKMEKENQTIFKENDIYSVGKLAADVMAREAAKRNQMEYISAVISNIYGPGEKSLRFLNTTVKKLLKNEKIQFSSGQQEYDFIYISDAAEAFYLIAEKGQAGSYYIGNSKCHCLKDYIFTMIKITKSESEYSFSVKYRPEEYLDYSRLFTGKMEKEFGFIPKVSFEAGVNRTIEWIKRGENGANVGNENL